MSNAWRRPLFNVHFEELVVEVGPVTFAATPYEFALKRGRLQELLILVSFSALRRQADL